MLSLPADHRLFTEHFPGDGREFQWKSEDDRRLMLASRAGELLTRYRIDVVTAVDCIIGSVEPEAPERVVASVMCAE